MEEQPDVQPRMRRRWLAGGCLVLLLVACLGISGILLLNRLSPADEADQAEPEPTATSAPVEETVEPAEVAAASTGRIAFVDPDGRLGTVGADGSEERLLTGGGDVFLFPAWSPDGARLAAVGQSASGPGVFAVEDADGATVQSLYVNHTGAPIYLYWSPAGDAVSFIANHDDGLGLYLAPADGAAEARLLATGSPFYWQWRASGEELLIHTGADTDDARLAFLGVDDGEAGADLARPGFFQAPGISADGRYLAWSEVDAAGARWLVVRDAGGDGVERLPHRGSIAMSWSPNPTSSQIAFISPTGSDERPLLGFQGPLRLLDATTGEIDVLSPQFVLAFFWSPDGSQIAYVTLPGLDEGMQAAGLRGPLPRRAKGTAQHGSVQLNLWVADVESGQSRQLLTFRPTSIYLTQFLPFFDQYALSHRIWAPDSSALVLPVAGDAPAGDGIYVVPVDGGNARRVAGGDTAFWSSDR